MSKPDPAYTVPRLVWVDAAARCDELAYAARIRLPFVIRYPDGRITLRRPT